MKRSLELGILLTYKHY